MKRLRHYSIPYLVWMGVFTLLPTLFLILLAFTDLSLYNLGPFSLSLTNFKTFRDTYILIALWNSLRFAFYVAIISFIIGYPVAYFLTTLSKKIRTILLALLIVPLWTNMLVRVDAWTKIFSLNSIFTDIFKVQIPIMGTEAAVIIALVAMYLPFMVFPIFSVLEKMDYKLIEASKDLGASDLQTFTKVVFPLSSGGVVSGFIMTFLPAMTSFALPEILGYRTIPMIGMEIQKKFVTEAFSNSLNINQGSLISLLIMLFSVASFVMIIRVDKEGETLI